MAIEVKDKLISVETLKVAYDALKIVIDNIVNNHTNNKDNPHNITVAQIGAVPITRTINGQALSSDIVLPVDTELSDTSENPVQNKAVGQAINELSEAVDHTINNTIANLRQVPECTTDNNGQFLRVVEGAAAWQTVPNAESANF